MQQYQPQAHRFVYHPLHRPIEVKRIKQLMLLMGEMKRLNLKARTQLKANKNVQNLQRPNQPHPFNYPLQLHTQSLHLHLTRTQVIHLILWYPLLLCHCSLRNLQHQMHCSPPRHLTISQRIYNLPPNNNRREE